MKSSRFGWIFCAAAFLISITTYLMQRDDILRFQWQELVLQADSRFPLRSNKSNTSNFDSTGSNKDCKMDINDTIIFASILCTNQIFSPEKCFRAALSLSAQVEKVFVFVTSEELASNISLLQRVVVTFGVDIGAPAKYIGNLRAIDNEGHQNDKVWIFFGDDSEPSSTIVLRMKADISCSFKFLRANAGSAIMVRRDVLDGIHLHPIPFPARFLAEHWLLIYLYKLGINVAAREELLDHTSLSHLQELEEFFGIQFQSAHIVENANYWPMPSAAPGRQCETGSDWYITTCAVSHVCVDQQGVYSASVPGIAPAMGRCDKTDRRHAWNVSALTYGTLPPGARWIQGSTALIRRYCPGNFGHLLLDTVAPALVSFFAMRPGADQPDHILIDDTCERDPAGAELFEYQPADCERLSRRVLPHFARRGLLFPRQSARPLCLETLVSSNCRYGLFSKRGGHRTIPKPLWHRFRAGPWSLVPRPARYHILVTEKRPGQRRRVVNIPEVVDTLRELRLGEVVHEDLGNVSFLRQVELVSHAFLFVAPGGGISIISVFLPANGTLLVGKLCVRPKASKCFNLDASALFEPMRERGNFHFAIYPVAQQDLVLPRGSLGYDYRMGDQSWVARQAREAHARFYSSNQTS